MKLLLAAMLCAASLACVSRQWTFVGPAGMRDFDQARAFCYGQLGQPPLSVGGDTYAATYYAIRYESCMQGQGWQLR